jgi:hypothetical protein
MEPDPFVIDSIRADQQGRGAKVRVEMNPDDVMKPALAQDGCMPNHLLHEFTSTLVHDPASGQISGENVMAHEPEGPT